MSLAVLVPYRADTPQRERIYEATSRYWKATAADVEVAYSSDGLEGLFSLARATNLARALVPESKYLLNYSVDALPMPVHVLRRLTQILADGTPWATLAIGQQRFTQNQTDRLIAGADLDEVGPAAGPVAFGRTALIGVRADVWDDLRGMDERFVGWGPEDDAWYQVLRTVHPDGCDEPFAGLFQTLAHPGQPMSAWAANEALWRSYPRDMQPAEMREWYLSR